MEKVQKVESYLGDGVYASFDGWMLALDLRGQDDSKIALEPEVFAALQKFAKKCGRAYGGKAED